MTACHRALLTLGLLLCSLAPPAWAASPIEADSRLNVQRDNWSDLARDALWWGDFEALNKQYAPTPDEAKQPFLRGDRRNAFQVGLDNVLDRTDASDLYYEQLEALTLGWAQEHPKSALAQYLYVEALMSHAYAIRGGRYASEVAPAAWEQFTRLNKKASQYLLDRRDVTLSDPQGYLLMIRMGRSALHLSLDRQWELAQAAIKLNPYDDAPYVAVLISLTPKWGGGSPENIDAFVREAVKLSREQWGVALYARLYSEAAAEQYGHGLLTETLVKWGEMKAGFEDLLKRTPSLNQRNRYAYFACMAKDKQTYRQQMALLESTDLKPFLGAWGSNAQRIYNDCKRWGSSL